MNSRVSLTFIILITLAAILVDLPKLPWNPKIPGINIELNNLLGRFPLKLGLDLQGGTELVLETQMDKIDTESKDSALESAREVIERRVNLFGVSEALVQSSKVGDTRRILVELPGLKDASSAAELVGKTALLEFREISASASAEASRSGIPEIFLSQSTGLTGADLKKAQVTYGGGIGASTGPQVSIEFTADGAKKFAELTSKNIGKPLPIFLDNQPISAPRVEQEILGGNAVITGQFSVEEAKNLSIQLNAGALPVPINIVEQRSIGPTLGQQSVNKSLTAGIVGLGVVVIYMVVHYGILGLIASFSLLIYTAIILAIFKTGGLILPPITLTLAGIAGFILSIGMAVDANILIFERMKEEKRWGKPKKIALELGFTRAWSSIWASNVSSLITAVILYSFGTSLVRGFAVTLAIGVLVSMFTAVVVTRTFLRIIVRS
ncbi:protein-export membrane protein SecD [Candidatus Daviesbacteria bacterium RIFCSPHIGHO2_12_FULL_37_11]|uniref:Protein translocase subunit SecD n=1 Tax=Candidatus Daviesbacteria bacterium RIFCSPHIGHO2_12_FULL_37_11 TaxID=1797777 RepID=A0A1F5K9K4_9BACT|nr:MAG: protein-export membrane protein SecD [Candidatus Daviesbacteria bacterium RIFCSPHIGHO2_01_FULL_37_27]OGE37579.1 MAG: protein-export membrane protein SecD [Candidatus Daviesbacteria bacterium RIFCSPHIGHO2_12_FULL_37_11]OGE46017.1 MAG: protein-export membrane protein SecD [Candidatus Daviesbacteria bacterium RIFCSPLOWO2_01_FULL_37_10]